MAGLFSLFTVCFLVIVTNKQTNRKRSFFFHGQAFWRRRARTVIALFSWFCSFEKTFTIFTSVLKQTNKQTNKKSLFASFWWSSVNIDCEFHVPYKLVLRTTGNQLFIWRRWGTSQFSPFLLSFLLFSFSLSLSLFIYIYILSIYCSFTVWNRRIFSLFSLCVSFYIDWGVWPCKLSTQLPGIYMVLDNRTIIVRINRNFILRVVTLSRGVLVTHQIDSFALHIPYLRCQ